MDQATKRFYRLQYRWKRLPHPDPHVMNDRKHPLHQIELKIAHPVVSVDTTIRAVLGGKGQFTYEDALQVVEQFTQIRFALEVVGASSTTEAYKLLIEDILELLKSGAAILRPSPSSL